MKDQELQKIAEKCVVEINDGQKIIHNIQNKVRLYNPILKALTQVRDASNGLKMNKYKLEKLRINFEIEFHKAKYSPSARPSKNNPNCLEIIPEEERLVDFNKTKNEYFTALDEMSQKEGARE